MNEITQIQDETVDTRERKPGEQLQRQREKLGLTVQQIARTLRISSQYVEDIENDTYEHFPGLVYIKGYLRSYSKCVELDPEEIIESFDALVDEKQLFGETVTSKHYVTPVSEIKFNTKPRRYKKWWVMLIGMALVGAYFLSHYIASVQHNAFEQKVVTALPTQD